jgi:hypothetical protein
MAHVDQFFLADFVRQALILKKHGRFIARIAQSVMTVPLRLPAPEAAHCRQ